MAVALTPHIHPLDRHLRVERLPTIHCPGCGIGIGVGAVLRALDRRINEGSINPEKVVWMAGIGCTARAVPYVNYDVGRCLHGRAVANALGAVIANPELKVIAVGGDGDIAAIGGNHLIHAARRNADILVLMFTNFTYAMTGGQVAPTTPQGLKTTTTPQGSPEPALSVIKLLASLNVNYVARASVTTPHYIEQFAYKALGMKGFRLIEVLSTCPERFG
ncbi:MAG: thiamine pyrophosphate-dependent enzyme, partial [Desulfurococcaceae archaeon]